MVKLTWDKDEDSIKEIKRAEKAAGISFDTTDTTVEIKISDELEKDKLKLEKAEDVDILDYIVQNNLAGTKGIKEGALSFGIKGFEYEVGNYKLAFKPNDYGVGTIHALEKDETLEDYTSNLGELTIKSKDSYYDLSTGDTVDIQIFPQHLSGTNIFIKGASKTFDIKANTPIDTETAKSNIDSIKAAFNEKIKDNSSVSNPVVANIYLFQKKNDSAIYENYIMVVFSCDYEGWFGDATKQYVEYAFTDAYMDGNELMYSISETGASRSKLETLEKNSYNLNNSDYTKVKIS